MGRKKDKGETELLTSYWRQWAYGKSREEKEEIGQFGMRMESLELDMWEGHLIGIEGYLMGIDSMSLEGPPDETQEEKYSETRRKLNTLLKDASMPEEKRRKEFKKLMIQKWELLQDMQRKKIEVFAKKHKLKFDESKKEQIINEIIKRHGFCQSKREQTKENACPCVETLEKIMKRGKCRRGLFIARENRRPETKKLDSWTKE